MNAFPKLIGLKYKNPSEFVAQSADGMSLRDYAALQALQGFCANPAVFAANPACGWGLVNCSERDLTAYCYKLADAAINARKETP
jgi:hypothetical protein